MTQEPKPKLFTDATPTLPVVAGPTLREIDANLAQAKGRVAKVNDRYADVLARILKIEGQSRDTRRKKMPDEILDAVLDGGDVNAAPAGPNEIDLLRTEKQVLIAAIARGNQRVEEILLQRAAFILAQYAPEIAELDKERVLLATRLQAINGKRETLRERLRELGCGGATFPTDRYAEDLLGCSFTDDPVMWSQRRAIEDGIITASEIARAKNA
jgi:hypothetical protein